MATDEILMVDRYIKDGSERCARCPHCGHIVYLPDGPARGEQFHHRGMNFGDGCGGWFEIAHDASIMRLTS